MRLAFSAAAFVMMTCSGIARAQEAAADTTTPSSGGGWSRGVSVGMPGLGGELRPEMLTVGFNLTQLRPGRIGLDVALGTMPRTLAYGFAAAGVRVGGALPVLVVPGVVLVPSAGVSLMGAAGEGGMAGTYGVQTGLAALIPTSGPLALRASATWHLFPGAREGVWLAEVGLASVPVALRRRP